MDPLILLQTESVLRKSAEMAQRDPYGWITAFVSIAVVFISLTLLFIIYHLIGRCVNRFVRIETPQEDTEAEKMKTQEDGIHDTESYILTFRGKDRISISSRAPLASASDSAEDTPDRPEAGCTQEMSERVITSPLPGIISAIKVKSGDRIKAGQVVAVLEAMKMENDLQAEQDGIVKEVAVEKGESVLEGAVIIILE